MVGSAGQTTGATGPSLVLHVDTARVVTVGDPVVVGVVVHLPPGAHLIDSVPRLTEQLSGVRLLSGGVLRATAAGYATELRFAFFRPDSGMVPSLAVAYEAGGAVDTVRAGPLPVRVVSVVTGEGATLRDIKELDSPSIATPLVVAGIGLGVVLGLLVVRASRRRRRTRLATLVAPVRASSPYECALDALAELAARDGLSRENVDTVYAATADVVRRYLDAAYDVPALERTTWEAVQALPARAGGPGAREALRALLDDADLVKFARERPDPATVPTFLARARAVIETLGPSTTVEG